MSHLDHIDEKIIDTTVGIPGRMISGSKSGYRNAYPERTPVFNSNLVALDKNTGKYQKIWHGDLDLTIDVEKLLKLSEALDTELMVLYEMDARFENENNPQVGRCLASYHHSRDPQVKLGEKWAEYFYVEGNVIKQKNS